MAETTYRLVIRRGPELNKMFELTAPLITLGRDIINDITISDPEMSRQHCQLARTDDGYVLEDLASTNGTFVNGERLSSSSRLLKNGDNIGFGETVLVTYTATSMPALPSKEASPSASKASGVVPHDADTSQIPTIKAATAATQSSAASVAEVPAPPAYVYAPPVPTTDPAANRMMLFGCGIFTAFCVIGVLLGVIFIDASDNWGDVPIIGDALEGSPVPMETIETQHFHIEVPKDWDYGRLEVEGVATTLLVYKGNLGLIGDVQPYFGENGGFWFQFLEKDSQPDSPNQIAFQILERHQLSREITESNEDTVELDNKEGKRVKVVNADGDYVEVVVVDSDTITLLFIALSPADDRQDNEKIFDYVLDHLRFE